MDEPFKIPLQLTRNETTDLVLELYPMRAGTYVEIDPATAKENGEARWQIGEGCEYEYSLPQGCRFADHPAISSSARNRSEGRIRPGNYVGRLSLRVIREDDENFGFVELESTSVKMDYRTDYQSMLNDLAEKSAELLMSSEEFVFQHYTIDPNASAETLYQQFAFAKSLISSDNFDAAVTRVCVSPIKEMRTMREDRPTTQAGRIGRDGVRQFAANANRDKLPSNHLLRRRYGWKDIPHVLEQDCRVETVDVPENRFVKFVLESFQSFLQDLSRLDNASEGLKLEAEALAEKLDYRLGDPLFREVSCLDRLPLSSPALQRREGYREILRAWLMFDSAAKIAWKGGDDVYQGGKRNVAALYEYWAFFKLFDIVASVFDFPKTELKKLIVRDSDNLQMSLKQGKEMSFKGEYVPSDGSRRLRALFSYNKTFSHKDNIEVQGSWTVPMRPDYTLSIWPASISRIIDAEKIDKVVHVHFDAKYKIDRVMEFFASSSNGSSVATNQENVEAELNELKAEEDGGVYKRGDLLKMHAYNDAIRRTYGSYILYPGDKDEPIRRYHEILPGIGAFVLRPGKNVRLGASEIEKFIRRVTTSLQDRLTQRERTAMYDWNVHRTHPVELSPLARAIQLPEYNGEGKVFIPAEEHLLIGYYHPEKWDWIQKNGYNFRLGLRNGSLEITGKQLDAEYILLHSKSPITNKLFRIDKEKGPRVMSKEDMIKLGYEKPSADSYLLLTLVPIEEGEPLYGLKCDISKLAQYQAARTSAHPITVTFEDVLTRAICE